MSASQIDRLPESQAVETHEGSQSSSTKFIHIACRRCNHYHKHVPWDVPHDPAAHKRFKCEKCFCQLFGVGRTSTHTTLASAESIPVTDQGVPLPHKLSICTAPTLVATIAQPEGIASLPPLNEISPSSAQSRSPLVESDKRQLKAQEQDETFQRKPNTVMEEEEEESVAALGGNPRSQVWSSTVKHLHRLGRRLKNRLYSVSRRRKTLGEIVTLHPWRRKFAGGESSAGDSAPWPRTPSTPFPEALTEQQARIDGSGSSSELKERSTSTADVHSSNHHSSSDVAEEIGNSDALAKGERLRSHRRERTLLKNALICRRCQCESHCHCKIGASITSLPSGTSVRPDIPRSQTDQGSQHGSLEIPSLPAAVMHLMIGEQFAANNASGPFMNQSAAGSNIPATENLSQGTTQVESEDAATAATQRDEPFSRPPSSGTQHSVSDSRQIPGTRHVILNGLASSVQDSRPRRGATSRLRHSIEASDEQYPPTLSVSDSEQLSVSSHQDVDEVSSLHDEPITNGVLEQDH